ncbi:MAG: GNAT family N-acetyltransferase [Chloroflexota bacterium]
MTVYGGMTLRQITEPDDPAIQGFGRMQTAVYFAPETLIPATYIPLLISPDEQIGKRRNFLLVAEHDGQVVGGALFHWLADPGAGFSSFMGVDQAFRGHGLARQLHERRLTILDAAAGGTKNMVGVFIDVVNPTRLSPEELQRETLAGSDPWSRRRVFERLGFRQVGIRYEQPVGGPNGGPVTSLDLLFCPHEPRDTIPTDFVVATMRTYWGAWLAERGRIYSEQLRERAQGQTELPLVSPVPDKARWTMIESP